MYYNSISMFFELLKQNTQGLSYIGKSEHDPLVFFLKKIKIAHFLYKVYMGYKFQTCSVLFFSLLREIKNVWFDF
jgi:hypothetical protein